MGFSLGGIQDLICTNSKVVCSKFGVGMIFEMFFEISHFCSLSLRVSELNYMIRKCPFTLLEKWYKS